MLALNSAFATGAAIAAALALFARQSLLVAYILLGGLIGPWGFGLVRDASIIAETGHIGIIFLLFLLGLNLHPWQLVRMLGEGRPFVMELVNPKVLDVGVIGYPHEKWGEAVMAVVVVKEGETVKVKVLEVDKQGRVRLSMKEVDKED